jgi:predicted metal-dependent peptidase
MTPEQRETQRSISRALLSIKTKSPFFATLALFAKTVISETLPTAATDGQTIYVNPTFMASLTIEQQAGLLLHEVLHAALLHVPRRGSRDPMVWNIAADIVVNGMIANETDFTLPPGPVRDEKLEHLSVEEVYHLLLSDPSKRDLLASVYLLSGDLWGPGQMSPELSGALGDEWRAKLEEHWRNALQQAHIIAQKDGFGRVPAALQRELGAIRTAQLDWRAHLWRFLVQTPNDFAGFDRRFIGRRLYLEALQGETVQVIVAVDTSGSIGGAEMEALLGEVQGILGAYPHVRCDLYYADAACYGPYSLKAGGEIPPPEGGGGTDFRPFFEEVAKRYDEGETLLCVYLTDGYGSFPQVVPNFAVLWVVTAGGLALEQFPFGEAVRLILEN